MREPRKINVTYADGRWRAELVPEYIGWFEAPTLTEFIDAVKDVLWHDQLIFVVDRPSFEGHLDAELQLLDASEKHGATVTTS